MVILPTFEVVNYDIGFPEEMALVENLKFCIKLLSSSDFIASA